jgi:predicted O-linked N-acetylglucosamine transferase (SPINDLY family)
MAGLDDLIASNAQAYVDLAVRLGNDREFRERVSCAIVKSCGKIFDDRAPIAALAGWIEDAVRSTC